MEILLMLAVFFAVMTIGILPIWALIVLYDIRRCQKELHNESLTEYRKLFQKFDTFNRIVSSIESRIKTLSTERREPVATVSEPPPKEFVAPATQVASAAQVAPAAQVVSAAQVASVKPEVPSLVARAVTRPIPSLATIPPREAAAPSVLHTVKKAEPIKVTPVSSAPSAFELAAGRIMQRIWNWIIVGEEFRKPGTSMEQAVATIWLMRISILLVVVGIGFGLKYSIDKGYLGPSGRVALSLISGAAMIAGGLPLLNKRYHIAGQGLIGGGLAVLYFGLFAGFSLWRLFDAMTAFSLMALVTVSAGVIAVRFNSLLIAILGILGGYGTPVMLSTGVENYLGLFSYMLLLGAGVLGIAIRRQWHLLNILAMACTYILYFAAVHSPGHYTNDKFLLVFPFLIAFFIMFSTVMFVYNLRRRISATLIEIIALLVNAAVVFAGGFELIEPRFGREWVAALTLALSLLYIGHVYLFLVQRLRDRAMLFCFLGLAAFFLTVSVPLALSGAWITTSWAALALVMYWMGLRLGSRFLQGLAGVVYVLVLGRFGLDMHAAFGYGSSVPVAAGYLSALAERLVQFGVPIGCFGAAWWLSRRFPAPAVPAVTAENDMPDSIGTVWVGRAGMVIMACLIFIYLQFEFFRLFSLFYEPLCLPSLTLVWVGMCAVLLLLLARTQSAAWRALLVLVCLATVMKLVFIDLMDWGPSMHGYRDGYVANMALVRLFDFSLVIAFLVLAFRMLTRGRAPDGRAVGIMMGGLSLGLLFIYLTGEVNTALQQYQPALRPGGVSLLWAVYALSLVFAGIVRNVSALRYIGLAMFAVVAAKLFFFDLEHMEIIFRMMVLVLIGVVMFAGSVFYQKYRERLDTGRITGDKGGAA